MQTPELFYLIIIVTVSVIYLFNFLVVISIGLVNPYKKVSTRQLVRAFLIPTFSLADCDENLF